ncbi:hypothetical protein CALCODRAFT_493005 [Calocera cornea HHB12733]|uniref:Uncharacterized protein n=1 Tax=Calocera cornea HHB12733 TaxID=1353952 RepID=A0A165I1M6_9BASI|nr:hypothetical protein CALCODRAFT_493005 [Calocera cornea HHB12733]
MMYSCPLLGSLECTQIVWAYPASKVSQIGPQPTLKTARFPLDNLRLFVYCLYHLEVLKPLKRKTLLKPNPVSPENKESGITTAERLLEESATSEIHPSDTSEAQRSVADAPPTSSVQTEAVRSRTSARSIEKSAVEIDPGSKAELPVSGDLRTHNSDFARAKQPFTDNG